MIAKRVFLLLILAVIVGVITYVFLSNKEPAPDELLNAEQKVYSALLTDQRKAYNIDPGKFQIVEYTNSGELRGNTPSDSAGYSLELDIDKFPQLQPETWADFQENNKTSYPINEYLPSTADVILVNPDNFETNSGANSDHFYWWVSFSRIGFNSSLTQALVLVGDCRGESCYNTTSVSIYSQGSYVLLQQKNGEWEIQSYQEAWFIEAPSP